MERRGEYSIRRCSFFSVIAAAPLGCSPTFSVVGVYFPGWLVSTLAGVVISYTIVVALARQSNTQKLADSGLLFVSLVISVALTVWWVCFSRF
jgi:predicted membrane protein